MSWTFQSLSRPTYNPGPFNGGGFSAPRMLNRADGDTSKSNLMAMAATHKVVAVATAGLTGGMAAYKGIPEIKNFAGFDILGGLVLAGVEFGMMYKGMFNKVTAAVGGASTGLLCHWSAVQGTIWGATKAKADTTVEAKGWDYEDDSSPRQLNQDRSVKHEKPSKERAHVASQGQGFDVYAGAF